MASSVRAEGGVGLLAGEARPAVLPVPQGRRDQRHEGGGEQHQRDREIHEGNEGEDEDRGEGGDDELGKVLAEVDLELLDAFDHREDDVPGASPGEVRGAQRGDALVDGLAQGALHARRRAVRRHRAPVVERAAKDDGGGREGDKRQQRAERPAGDHVGEEPAEEGQARDADADGEEADQRGARDAQPHAAREGPQATIEIDCRAPSSPACRGWASHFRKVSHLQCARNGSLKMLTTVSRPRCASPVERDIVRGVSIVLSDACDDVTCARAALASEMQPIELGQ